MQTTLVINDTTPQAKMFIAYGRTLPFVKIRKEKTLPEFNLYDSLDHALSDVRLMIDGKKKKKTAQQFLEEIRNGK